MNQYFPNLFMPIKIKNVRFKNRIISAPNFIPRVTADKCPDAEFIRYYEDKAKGGAASVTVPGGAWLDVCPTGGFGKSYLRVDEYTLQHYVELATAIKQHGAVATFQLAHAGMHAPGHNGGDPIGPSATVRRDGAQVREMTLENMKEITESFARSAALLKKAGFDMLQIHGGHGWLQSQFLAPGINKRTDEFGGKLENRARFPIMILDRIREVVGQDMLIEYRISGDEFDTEGYKLDDGIAFCKMIQDKVDILHISAARDCSNKGAVITHPTIFLKNGCNVYLAEAVKREVLTPVAAIGAINTPELAEEVIAARRADFVAISRAIIADPEFPNKARTGRREEINPCVRCLNCLTGEQERETLHCSVNPIIGNACRLDRYNVRPDKPQRVVVIGGGAGGMKAAITAAERGHTVTLYEKADSLGGILRFTDHDVLKVDLRRFKNYLVNRTMKLPIDIKLGVVATPDVIMQHCPDTVIIAVGSSPIVPSIPGLKEYATHVLDAYTINQPAQGAHIVIIGGGLAGCESAVNYAQLGYKVTIVEMQDTLAPDANWMQQEGMKAPINDYSIKVITGAVCTAIESGFVKVCSTAHEDEFTIEADLILYALGMRANAEALMAFEDSALNVVAVGDCTRARQVEYAVHEAFYAALNL